MSDNTFDHPTNDCVGALDDFNHASHDFSASVNDAISGHGSMGHVTETAINAWAAYHTADTLCHPTDHHDSHSAGE